MSELCVIKCILDDSFINDIEMIEVFVDTVCDPRNISSVVLSLNSNFPVPELTHLKRVRLRDVLLFPCKDTSIHNVHEILKERNFQTELLKNDVKKVRVAATPPLVRHQYTKCHSMWPCNFHADKYLEKLCSNTLFSAKEVDKIWELMKIAKEVGNYSETPGKNDGVVIVDPKIDSIVAVGYDRTNEGPCRHAIMVALDNVAKTQNGGVWKTPHDNYSEENNLNLAGIPQEILTVLKKNYSDITFGSSVFISNNEESEGPYLCTNYHVYSTREPCVMCAMALVHSRCKRIFYNEFSANGALGTLCKIHTVKHLNHHYEVFVVENFMGK
ncbi:hypothetical protein HHI36_003281 [Cryptolaemus montrouzieri]|uniref:CMP/dCMP-type deaminase domain-containing protein n=1 Tax=Cryptolaemus montrouzieri TaxID=559131 RepID=A0ABD2PDG5_9CUCU